MNVNKLRQLLTDNKISTQIKQFNDCLICVGNVTSDGYGKVTINGKQLLVHRLVYHIVNLDLTDEEVVRHTCHVRRCINPDHLLKGSHNDNVQDRVLSGRSAKGANNGRAKLTEENVVDIYLNTSLNNASLGAIYGVDRKVIYNIKNKLTWIHVTNKLD